MDRLADAGYIKVSNKKMAKTICASEYCNLDVAKDGTVVGIELLFISKYMSDFKFWLSLTSAANYLNKSPITIRRWAKEGKIPHYKIGNEYTFVLDDLNNFVKERRR